MTVIMRYICCLLVLFNVLVSAQDISPGPVSVPPTAAPIFTTSVTPPSNAPVTQSPIPTTVAPVINPPASQSHISTRAQTPAPTTVVSVAPTTVPSQVLSTQPSSVPPTQAPSSQSPTVAPTSLPAQGPSTPPSVVPPVSLPPQEPSTPTSVVPPVSPPPATPPNPPSFPATQPPSTRPSVVPPIQAPSARPSLSPPTLGQIASGPPVVQPSGAPATSVTSPAPPINSRAPRVTTVAVEIPTTDRPVLVAPPTSRRPRNDDLTPTSSQETPQVTLSPSNKEDVVTYDGTLVPKMQDPVGIPDFKPKTVPPVILDINESEKTNAPKKYIRDKVDGSDDKAEGSSTDIEGEDSPSEGMNQPRVIGGRKRGYLPTNEEYTLSKSAESVYDLLRYASSTFAGISVALLFFFHYISLDTTLPWTGSVWSPNTWEFLVYVGFLQQMASVSQMALTKSPKFLLEFTDSFSWTNFVLQYSPKKSQNRRLAIIIIEGVVAYADRIGIPEAKILYHSIVGFLIVLGILLTIFFVIATMAKRQAEFTQEYTHILTPSHGSVKKLRSIFIRTLGLCVLVWFFALFPLSTFSCFEIYMEFGAKQISDAISLAIIALGIICCGVLAVAGRSIMNRSHEQLKEFENLATWGSLYAEFTYSRRMFFVFGALLQIISGSVVGAINDNPAQLIIVIVLQVAFLIAVLIFSPFADAFPLELTVGLSLIKVMNYGLAFAFTRSNGMSSSGRGTVAQVYIIVNTLVVLLWFVRLLVVFSTYIRVWMTKTRLNEGNEDVTVGTSDHKTRSSTHATALFYTGLMTSRVEERNQVHMNAKHLDN